jgi:hypothetical protein
MNLRAYYRRIRETAQALEGDSVWIVSLPTSDGGRGGVYTEAPRVLAAQLIVNGKAKPATAEEGEAYEARRRSAEVPDQSVRRVQVALDGAGARLKKRQEPQDEPR